MNPELRTWTYRDDNGNWYQCREDAVRANRERERQFMYLDTEGDYWNTWNHSNWKEEDEIANIVSMPEPEPQKRRKVFFLNEAV